MTSKLSMISALTIVASLSLGACSKKEEAASEPGVTTASAQPSTAAEPSAAGDGTSGIPECDTYLAAMDKYMTCDKIPQATRDATKQGMDATKQSWAQLKGANVPEASKQAAASGCKSGYDALLQGAKAMGCSM